MGSVCAVCWHRFKMRKVIVVSGIYNWVLQSLFKLIARGNAEAFVRYEHQGAAQYLVLEQTNRSGIFKGPPAVLVQTSSFKPRCNVASPIFNATHLHLFMSAISMKGMWSRFLGDLLFELLLGDIWAMNHSSAGVVIFTQSNHLKCKVCQMEANRKSCAKL